MRKIVMFRFFNVVFKLSDCNFNDVGIVIHISFGWKDHDSKHARIPKLPFKIKMEYEEDK